MSKSFPPAALACGVAVLVLSCSAPPKRPNLVLLVLDAVRADFVGAFSDRWGAPSVTPNLDRLASTGSQFRRAVSSGNWTRPTTASLMSGLPPYRHGDWRGGGGDNYFRRDELGRPLAHQLDEAHTTLAERLAEVGYATGVFPPTLRGQYHPDSGFHQGFETVRGAPKGARNVRTGQTLEILRRWLAGEAAQPFFAHVHTLGAHAPFTPEAEDLARFDGRFPDNAEVEPRGRLRVAGAETRGDYLRRYAALLSAADRSIGEFFEALEEMELREDTIVAITADHGETLGDHGQFGHGGQLYQEVIWVPLIVVGPGVPIAVEDGLANSEDVVATLLDLAGVAPDDSIEGRSLIRGENFSAPAWVASFQSPTEVAIWTDRDEKLIYSRSARATDGFLEFYDLTSDPLEESNQVVDRSERAHELYRLLEADVLRKTVGWHVVLPATDQQTTWTVQSGEPLFGEVSEHCVPRQGRSCVSLAGALAARELTEDARTLQLTASEQTGTVHLIFRTLSPRATLLLGSEGQPGALELSGCEAARQPVLLRETATSRPLETWCVPYPEAADKVLDEDVQDRLEGLGYLG